MPICSRCKTEKESADFYVNLRRTSGITSWCRACYAENNKGKKQEKSEYDAIYWKNTRESRKESKAAYAIQYYKNNLPYIRGYDLGLKTRKYSEDLSFKLKAVLRSRLRSALKKETKKGSAVSDLGCSIEELKEHLESKFQSDMTWENYGRGRGKWGIDHLIPLDVFDLADRQHVVLACNYLNLQPMWNLENSSKGSKYPELS